MDNQTIGEIELSCHLSLPSKIKIPDNIFLSGRYELCIYTGAKPLTLESPLTATGILLCKVGIGGKGLIIADGMAGYFVLLRDEKVVFIGTVGTSGTDLVLPNIDFVKGGFFTVDSFSEQTLAAMKE